ncbi:MAG TPA: hypothetical protein VHA05_01705 [Candidatus Saccharimonadales bacterium]|nr:hypothetical protein [Candidatus Saccharimonadales bacterium]
MDSAKTQLADRLKSANNILVTVSRDPSIDQLAACLGLTLLLNKMNKHSVAVFSGQVPSTIEFLKPAETIEKNTDSLRDFIIALDKDKADKLRYKVEDNVVRIFITPYKTSITEKDLEFSQGDFNVDVVVALGVQQQQDLDASITAHGRILHDATVASISLQGDGGNLGTINWKDTKASSLSELVTDLVKLLGDNLLDNQIATALLTGIVAATDRFSNNKTSSSAMEASSVLMAAGADQQLVAAKLEEPEQPPAPEPTEDGSSDEDEDNGEETKSEPGELNIKHDKKKEEAKAEPEPAAETEPGPEQKLPTPRPPEPVTDIEPPALAEPFQPPQPQPELQSSQPGSSSAGLQPGAKLITDDEPSLGGTLNANTKPEGMDPVTDPMSMPQVEQNRILDRKPLTSETDAPQPQTNAEPTPAPVSAPAFTPPQPAPDAGSDAADSGPSSEPAQTAASGDHGSQTLTEIEQSVHSPHIDPAKLETARDQVSQALQDSVDPTPTPIKALNAQPLGGSLHSDQPPAQPPNQPSVEPIASTLPFDNTPESSDTAPTPPPSADSLSPSPQVTDPTSAPTVPPPFMPQSANNSDNDAGSQSVPL